MTVNQLPAEVREFAQYLNKLMAKLDQGGGWCAVFWQRDPDGMRACLDGQEVPPWDVVEALMHDLDTAYGPAAAAQETERARALHSASLAAYDARPGGRDALGDRLDVMLREQRYAAERAAELTRRLRSATTRVEADTVRLDLAWAHDDRERATARCTELRTRIEHADRRVPHDFARDAAHGRESTAGSPVPVVPEEAVRTVPDADPGAARAPEAAAPAPLRQRAKRRPRGGARFAGAVEAEDGPPVASEDDRPLVPAAAPAAGPGGRAPRGARYAGVAERTEGEAAAPAQPRARQPLDDDARREVAGTVEHLLRLRREGRSGEAHGLLVEAARWPAARFPLLAADLHRAGLDADWATLLWEAGSLPADRLVAVADALHAVGRAPDGEQMLRQGVARPAEEIGEAVLALTAEGREREARALLDVYVRVRTPEEAARTAQARPRRLRPLVLEAARRVSEERYREVVHALRVQGLG
ncbi:hypothetical protein [Streptomyces scabiei]|uniref:UL36 very large tegument protein n=1 Tax=Streptomyces scabiei TaxID=1930 RepID=A0A100JQJ8_STRSC|nr:hypothetical protein [Streptomyces scabiei]GAQ63822.1 hypothetical protein SsS58_04208 [Streptomyces scabiei]